MTGVGKAVVFDADWPTPTFSNLVSPKDQFLVPNGYPQGNRFLGTGAACPDNETVVVGAGTGYFVVFTYNRGTGTILSLCPRPSP